MKTLPTTLAVLLILITAVQSAEPPVGKPVAAVYSPSREIIVEHQMKPAGDKYVHEIWLVAAQDRTKRALLFTHGRVAEVVFSPDEHWLAINDRAGSGYSGVLVFKKKAGLEYDKVADCTTAAWDYFNRRHQLRTTPFDHAYADAVAWISADPPVILLRLSGHSSQPNANAKSSQG